MKLPGPLRRYLELKSRVADLEPRVRFLVVENLRLNQLLLELIWLNDLKRTGIGRQTKGSFDYQWREIPAGEVMPTNPASSVRGPTYVVKTGKTTVLDGGEWRRLIDAIPSDTVRELRDWRMVRRRAAARRHQGPDRLPYLPWGRDHGVLENGGTLEHAQAMAVSRESPHHQAL